MRNRLTSVLGVRVTPEVKQAYLEQAAKEPNRDPSEVLRDIIVAYTQNRLTIEKEPRK